MTQRPPSEFEGKAKLVIGDDSRIDAQLAIGGSLSSTMNGQIALASNNRDGYVDRVVDGGELGDVDQQVGQGALDWSPSEHFSAHFIVDVTRQRQNSAPSLLADINPGGSILGLYNGFVARATPITPADAVAARANYSQTRQTGPNQNDLDVLGFSTTLEWELNNMMVRSITAYRDMEADFGRDGDNTPLQYVHTLNHVEQDQFSQELQFIGTSFDDRLEWLVGLYHFQEEASDFNRPRLASGLFSALESLSGQLSGSPCAPPFVAPGCPGNPINVALDLDLNILTQQEVTSNALFGNASYALTEALSLNVGLRYTDEEKDFEISSFREGSGVVIFPPGTTASENWGELSYRFGLDYQISADMLLYTSLSRGFRSGGFNARPTTAGALQTYDPEFLRTLEFGVKADLLDNLLRLNVSAFFGDHEDIQLLSRSLDPATGTFISLIQNAAEASVNGMELELTALLSDTLTLNIGLGYLDASYDDIGSAAGITTDSELFLTPEYNANISLIFDQPLSSGAVWSSRIDYSYTDDYFFESVNVANLKQDSYGTTNLRTSYLSSDSAYEIAAFITNVGDKEYFVAGGSALGSFGTAEVTLARLREWGLSFIYNF